jgi:glycosyltransferase involved in cell wall biosynthesis
VAKPAITVLVDTYNHERFIEEALVSVMEQDFSPAEMEILVVDDGSTDRTPEIVRKFEPRVRLIRKKNGGQASAFNAGIPEAQGEIVAFLDGDDWWAQNKLSRVAEAMSAGSELGIVGHGIIVVQLDGRQQSEILEQGFRFQADTLEGARLFRLRKSFMGTSRMTIRADLLRRIGAVPESLTVQADEYLFTLASVLAPAGVLADALTFYRLHDANAFQFSRHDPAKARTKQRALAALAQSLADQLERLGIEPRAQRAISEIVKAEADQVRLSLDGGWPWETVRAEWIYYTVTCPDAVASHRFFKALSLLPALVLKPTFFYLARQRVSQSPIFRLARNRWLPAPEPQHVDRSWRTGS